MADRARFWGRVGGIFHTDEMPAYGITQEEIDNLKNAVKANPEDAIVFVADTPENARDALKAVVERAKEAIKGVPEETRAANPDGTTRYMRPRPGAARMYPETDIPPTQVTEVMLGKIRAALPELPEQKFERLMKQYKLNQKLAKQIMDSEHSELFEAIVKESSVSPTTVAVFLTETLKALKRDGVETEKVSENKIREIFRQVAAGKLTKEAISEIYIWLSKNEEKTVEEAINALGFKTLSEVELTALVEKALAENEKIVKEKRQESFGALMGMLMQSLRGKVDAAQLSKILTEKT